MLDCTQRSTQNISCINKISILKPSSNWSLFKLIISDKKLIKLKLFLPIYVHLNGQTLRVFLNSFLLLQKFGLKMQKSTFLKKKNGFESSFYKIDV